MRAFFSLLLGWETKNLLFFKRENGLALKNAQFEDILSKTGTNYCRVVLDLKQGLEINILLKQ